MKELNSPSKSCFLTELFLLVNSLSMPTGSAVGVLLHVLQLVAEKQV